MASCTFTTGNVTTVGYTPPVQWAITQNGTPSGTIYSILAAFTCYSATDTIIDSVQCSLGNADNSLLYQGSLRGALKAGETKTLYCAFGGIGPLNLSTINSLTFVRVGLTGTIGCTIAGIQTITCSDQAITPPIPPTTIGTDNPNPVSGEQSLIEWNESAAGTNNPVIGYRIYASTDGVSYSLYTSNVYMYGDPGGSLLADCPQSVRYYKVRPIGPYTPPYDVGQDADYSAAVLLTRVTATRCLAPTSVWVNNNLPGGNDTVNLYWEGAMGGLNNPIGSYLVIQYNLINSVWNDNAHYTVAVGEVEGSGSLADIPFPVTDGESYYYQVVTISSRDASNLDSASPLPNAAVLVTRSDATVTECGAPTVITVDNPNPQPGETVTISFSGASAGIGNAIAEYHIYTALDDESEYTYLTKVVDTNTYSSVSGIVAPLTPGKRAYFKVVTVGVRYNKDSVMSESVEVRTLTLYCLPPSAVVVSALVAQRSLTLSWVGAAPGIGNAITSYIVQASHSSDGVTWGEWQLHRTVVTPKESGATHVTVSETLGYRTRYRVQTRGAAGETYYSEWSAESDAVVTALSTATTRPPLLIAYEYPHIVDGVEKGPYPIGIIRQYGTLIITRKYWGIGEMMASIPFSEAVNEMLVPGNLLGEANGNEQYRIVSRTISKDAKGVESIDIKAVSLVSFLGKRVVTKSVLNNARPVSQIKLLLRNQPILLDVYNSYIGEYVPSINGDLLPDSYGDRRFADFHWREQTFDQTESETISFQPELLSNVLDNLVSLCKIEGCGVRVLGEYYDATADSLSLWMQLYKGLDRSTSQDENPHVIFDERLGNVVSQTYTHNIDGLATAGYATSQVLDTILGTDKRLIDLASDLPYTPIDQTYINSVNTSDGVNGGSGIARSEIGLTISDIESPTTGSTADKANAVYAASRQIGRNEINKAGEERTLAMTVNPAVGPQYGVDYDVGDIVTGSNPRWGVKMDARITEARKTYEAGKLVKVDLTFGDPVVSLTGIVRQIARRRG